MEQLVDHQIFAEFVESSFNELDELATHHIVESACVEDIDISSLDHESIIFRVEGYVECTLQYGSSSDVRRDEGSVIGESFPFACNFSASVHDPLRPTIDVATLKIDNSSWFD